MIPKLVRDKVPEIIRANGLMPLTRRLEPGTPETRQYLRAKLVEEFLEYMQSGRDEELVDLREVLDAIWANTSHRPFSEATELKRDAAGGFADLVVLMDVCDHLPGPIGLGPDPA